MSAAAPAICTSPSDGARPVRRAAVARVEPRPVGLRDRPLTRGRRPSSSARAATGCPAMTWVKLTFSLAAVSAASTARASSPPAVPVRAASATPSSAPERVRARVAEHDLLAEVGRQQRRAGTERAGGDAAAAAERQRRADHQPGLDRPAGPQVEQVDQVGRAGDDPGAEQHVGGAPQAAPVVPAAEQRRGHQAGRADPGDLDQAAGDPALAQRAQVAGEALGGLLLGPVADDVVVEADRTGDRARGDAAAAVRQRRARRARRRRWRRRPARGRRPASPCGRGSWCGPAPADFGSRRIQVERAAGDGRADAERPEDSKGHGWEV